ncbi:MAG: nitronate monooxygenase [Pseudomonadota bacterium]
MAAGGIADGRGWVAATALGAEGIQMGTRFVAVTENPAHPRYKEAILLAKDADTAIASRKIGPARSLNGDLTRKLKELEASGASAETVRAFIGFRRARKAQLNGALEAGEAYAGSSAGLVHDIPTAAGVIHRMVEEYERVMREFLNETR